jgi:hypothetical protein
VPTALEIAVALGHCDTMEPPPRLMLVRVGPLAARRNDDSMASPRSASTIFW